MVPKFALKPPGAAIAVRIRRGGTDSIMIQDFAKRAKERIRVQLHSEKAIICLASRIFHAAAERWRQDLIE